MPGRKDSDFEYENTRIVRSPKPVKKSRPIII